MWNAAQIDEELQQRDGTIRKTQTKMLVGKSVVTEMKDAFDRLISELNTAEERSSELEGKQNLHKLKNKDKKEWRKKITGHQSYETIANNL